MDYPGWFRDIDGILDDDDLNFTFSTMAFFGVDSAGTWRVTIRDQDSADVGYLNGWSLQFFGDESGEDDEHIYTNEYLRDYIHTVDWTRLNVAEDLFRQTLTDTGGQDRINASAPLADQFIDLTGTIISKLGDRDLNLVLGTVIEDVITGDANDTLIGNEQGNVLEGGRGNDSIAGGAGDDTLAGGAVADVVTDFHSGVGSFRLYGLTVDAVVDTDTGNTGGADATLVFFSNGATATLLGVTGLDEADLF
jgi:Ca2+-binding RTX toxin-like protein